jgi:hypothetical protein
MLDTELWYILSGIANLPSWFLSDTLDVELNIRGRARKLSERYEEQVVILKKVKKERIKRRSPTEMFLFKRGLKGGYFMAVDGAEVDAELIRSVVDDSIESKREYLGRSEPQGVVEKVLRKAGRDFGVQVRVPGAEHDFAWQLFDGKRRTMVDGKEVESDELIGIVYDGNYDCLEGLWHAVETEEGLVVI